MKIFSFSPFGYEGSLVTIEVDLRRGIPAVDIVGLADNAVKESRERMRAAIVNSALEFPKERVLISLSPADLKKEGAGFDLAVALAVLLEQKSIHTSASSNADENIANENATPPDSVLVMGELELSGKLRPVRGIHAAVATAKEAGVKFCIVSKENELEASGEMDGVFACSTLKEAFEALQKIEAMQKMQNAGDNINGILTETHPSNASHNSAFSSNTKPTVKIEFPPVEEGEDFAQVVGQEFLVRALQIAASGRHNLLAFGPPGCGKTLALQRYKSLMPYLSEEESHSVTRIYSLAGLIGQNISLVKQRPFRMPHQSASLEGMCGGGPHCMPGEASLAHNGVLFMDEAAEFRTSVLQMLRVPLEQHCITLSRAGRNTTYPADFQLLLATNPCPCGNFGSEDKICLCSARSVEQYWKKFSAPLLDRIDIRVPVFGNGINKSTADLQAASRGISSEDLRVDIARAISVQMHRQGKYNSRLTPEEISYFCKLNDECTSFLEKTSSDMGFSIRAVHSAIKLARTIADMEESYEIRLSDLKEALEYRKNEGGLSLCF